MKVFIVTEGGKGIGFGHITRCSALCSGFKEKGIRPCFIVNGDNSVKPLLKGIKSKIFNWLKKEAELLDLVSAADVVIIDSYSASIGLFRKIAGQAKLAVYIDDNNRIRYPRGIVVNGTINAKDLNYPKIKGVTYLLGTKYLLLRKEFWRLPKKKIRKEVNTIMVTFGGDDSRDMMGKVLKLLILKYPQLTKKVMLGKGFDKKNLEGIRALKDGNTELIYYPDANKMIETMTEADIAISAGGQTLGELARIGLPTIAVAVADNQLNHVKGWREAGFIDYAGWHRSGRLFAGLSKDLDRSMDYQTRLKKSGSGRSQADGKGPSRIVNKIFDLTAKNSIRKNNAEEVKNMRLRKAGKNDCFDILSWRNHPAVRGQSFRGREISYLEHKGWFSKKLHDKDTKIYIAEIKGPEKIGQIRFDIMKGRSARVNVNLNPVFLGMGFGSRIIAEGTRLFLKENPGINVIAAEILNRNIASSRAFQKAGYIFSRSLLKNNKKTSIYEFGD